MRKSPFRHHVRQHKRSVDEGSITVHDYMRGDGEQPINLSDPQLHNNPKHSSFNYIVHIHYLTSPTENIPVSASTYPQAIESAMLSRVNTTPPTQVEATKQ